MSDEETYRNAVRDFIRTRNLLGQIEEDIQYYLDCLTEGSTAHEHVKKIRDYVSDIWMVCDHQECWGNCLRPWRIDQCPDNQWPGNVSDKNGPSDEKRELGS